VGDTGTGCTSKRSETNKFVSTLQAPSLTCLQWARVDKKVRQSKLWEFMGVLIVVDKESGCSHPFDKDLLRCKQYFGAQLNAGKDRHVQNLLC